MFVNNSIGLVSLVDECGVLNEACDDEVWKSRDDSDDAHCLAVCS